MVKRNRRFALLFAIFFFSWVLMSEADFLPSGEPYALAVGQAYTALAEGPLAPLWNPAGHEAISGIQGALAFCPLPDESVLLYVGASVAAVDGPAVSWTSAKHSNAEGEILGTFSYPLSSGLRIGGSLAYLFGREAASVSFNAGVSWCGERFGLGVSGFGLESLVTEGKGSPRVLLGARWRAFPWMKMTLDLHFDAGDMEVALGGEASVGALHPRWGSALSFNGGLTHLGFGLGLLLAGFSADIGVGLMPPELQLIYSLGVTTTFAAWW